MVNAPRLRLVTLLFLILAHFLASGNSYAQLVQEAKIEDDDMNIGGDIFDDFNDEQETTKVLDDEQFYNYGRFFWFSLGVGYTGHTGNRGRVYENAPPTFGLSVGYFMNFRAAFTIGVEFSKHDFAINSKTRGYQNQASGPGLIDVSMLRTFFGTRFYIDTFDLGTAITWANPYLAGRIEYWNQTNRFVDQPSLSNQSGGGLGFGLGAGLEFPIVIKEYYVNVEALYHKVNFFDKYTQDYRPIKGSNDGIQDLSGDVFSFMVSYVLNW